MSFIKLKHILMYSSTARVLQWEWELGWLFVSKVHPLLVYLQVLSKFFFSSVWLYKYSDQGGENNIYKKPWNQFLYHQDVIV